MREALRLLVQLTKLDGQLAALEEEEQGLPPRRASLEQERALLRERLEAAHAEIASREGRQRQLEGELADAEALLGRLQEQQYEIHSRDAFQALLHEMETARGTISEHESEILELMERLDASREALSALEQEQHQAESRIEEQLRALAARAEQLAKETTRLRQGRSELAPQIEPTALERYERIAAHRRPAVAVVVGQVCAQCQVGVPPQLVLQLLAAESLVACASCRRLLVHERLVEE